VDIVEKVAIERINAQSEQSWFNQARNAEMLVHG
jgi:hypothetical protein